MDDSTVAVVAHGLLANIAVIKAAAETLKEGRGKLDGADVDRVVDTIVVQATHVAGVLSDLIRGFPEQVIVSLARLEEYQSE